MPRIFWREHCLNGPFSSPSYKPIEIEIVYFYSHHMKLTGYMINWLSLVPNLNVQWGVWITNIWIADFSKSGIKTIGYLDAQFLLLTREKRHNTVGIWLTDMPGNQMVETCPITEWFVKWMPFS